MAMMTPGQRIQALQDMLTDVPERLPRSALKSARERQGLTQTQLSEKTGVTQSEISRVESGERLHQNTAQRLAGAVGMAPAQLEQHDVLCSLKQAATKGELDQDRVLDIALDLARERGDDRSNAAVSGLLEVLKAAVFPEDAPEGELQAATKSAIEDEVGEGPDPNRDYMHRSIVKSWEKGDQTDRRFAQFDAAQKSAQEDKTQPDPNRDESGRSLTKSWEK